MAVLEKPPSRAGRPRSTQTDRAVLDAALELLIEGGVDAVKVEAVAKRSGVVRATVYRRYPRRQDLVVAAVAEFYRSSLEQPAPDEPTVEDMVESIAVALADRRARMVLRRMVTVPHDHPALFAEFREATGLTARDEAIRDVLRRAAERGRFPPGVDLETVQLLFTASISTHLLSYPDDTRSEPIAQYLYRVLHALGYQNDQMETR